MPLDKVEISFTLKTLKNINIKKIYPSPHPPSPQYIFNILSYPISLLGGLHRVNFLLSIEYRNMSKIFNMQIHPYPLPPPSQTPNSIPHKYGSIFLLLYLPKASTFNGIWKNGFFFRNVNAVWNLKYNNTYRVSHIILDSYHVLKNCIYFPFLVGLSEFLLSIGFQLSKIKIWDFWNSINCILVPSRVNCDVTICKQKIQYYMCILAFKFGDNPIIRCSDVLYKKISHKKEIGITNIIWSKFVKLKKIEIEK